MSVREHPVFKFLTRPIIAFAVIFGLFMLLFPNFGTRELSLFYRLPAGACATEVTTSAFQDEALAHSITLPIRDQRSIQSTISMPRASYRVQVELACPNGQASKVAERSVDLREDQALSIDLTNKCPCDARSD